MRKYQLFMMLMVISIAAFCQDDHWQIKLRNGELITDVVFHGLENDTLTLLNSGPLFMIPIQDIVELRNTISDQKKTIRTIVVWVGSGIAAGAITGIIGYSIREANKPPPAPPQPGQFLSEGLEFGPEFDAIGGGVVGGLVGLVVGSLLYGTPYVDEVYDFDKMNYPKKIRVLYHILPKGKS